MKTIKPRAKAVYRLPTVAAFKQLSVEQRTLVFAKWLERQPRRKTYDYADYGGCVLATFGQALYGSPHITAGGWAVHPRGRGKLDVFHGANPVANALNGSKTTYGAASDRVQAALAK